MLLYDKNQVMIPDISESYGIYDSICLPIDVYLPKVKNHNNRIAIVNIHGGGWTTGVTASSVWNGGDMVHQARYFSTLGYVGIVISYRSIKNENTDIMDLICDCCKAVRYIKTNYDFIDGDKLVLMGDSAGAHLATCLGISSDDSVRPAIVIACNPVLDCRKRFSYASTIHENCIKATPLLQSPSKCARFLIMNGDEDQVTPLSTAMEFHERLKMLQFDSELMVLRGCKHAFILFNYISEDKDVIAYMSMVDTYLQKKLKLKEL